MDVPVLLAWGLLSGFVYRKASEAAGSRRLSYSKALTDGEALLAQGSAPAALEAFYRAFKWDDGLAGWIAKQGALGGLGDQERLHQRLRNVLGLARCCVLLGELEMAEGPARAAVSLGPGDGSQRGRPLRPEEGPIHTDTLHAHALTLLCEVLVARCEERCAAGEWKEAQRLITNAERGLLPSLSDEASRELRARAVIARATATRLECRAQLVDAALFLLRRNWDAAEVAGARALLLADCDDNTRAAENILRDSKVGRFDEKLSSAEAHLAAREWITALSEAEAALQVAPDSASRQRAQGVKHTAAARAFEERLRSAQAHLAARRWASAESEAVAAHNGVLSDGPNEAESRAAATVVIGAAREGAHQEALANAARAFQEAMARAAAAIATRRWLAAETEATAALRHIHTDAPNAAQSRAAAHGVIADARARAREEALAAAALAFQQAMARAQAALAARRWREAQSEAVKAHTSVLDGALHAVEDRAAANSVFEAARAGERRDAAAAAEALRLQEASDAAEPKYAERVDAYLRRHRDFSGENPLALCLSLESVRQGCPPPAALLGSLDEFVRRNAHMFTLRERKVSVTTLTPFRGGESHRVFGEFKCTAKLGGGRPCGKRWKSAGTYCDKYQQCQSCEAAIYPFSQHKLLKSEGGEDRESGKPHDTDRCERCQELHGCCMPYSVSTGMYAAAPRARRGRGNRQEAAYGGAHGAGGYYDYDD